MSSGKVQFRYQEDDGTLSIWENCNELTSQDLKGLRKWISKAKREEKGSHGSYEEYWDLKFLKKCPSNHQEFDFGTLYDYQPVNANLMQFYIPDVVDEEDEKDYKDCDYSDDVYWRERLEPDSYDDNYNPYDKYGDRNRVYHSVKMSKTLKPRKSTITIVCINDVGMEGLTDGKKYESKKTDDDMCDVIDDNGNKKEFFRDRFNWEQVL